MNEGRASENKNMCTSVFKSGGHASIKERITIKWIELINCLEKDREAAVKRQR